MTTVSPTAGLTIDTHPGFAHRTVQTLVIEAPLDAVYGALFEVREWPQYLPHVQEIDVRYDDGRYQEFFMTVASETDGSQLRVRSIRNCRPGEIEFFQPEPPEFLKHHGGIWRFTQAADNPEHTHVEVTHVWNLHEEVAPLVYPATGEASTEEQVTTMLAGHSKLALDSWRKVLTGKGGE
ncbi:SRPBCC family protein [Kitasatospora sp. NPDC001159]